MVALEVSEQGYERCRRKATNCHGQGYKAASNWEGFLARANGKSGGLTAKSGLED